MLNRTQRNCDQLQHSSWAEARCPPSAVPSLLRPAAIPHGEIEEPLLASRLPELLGRAPEDAGLAMPLQAGLLRNAEDGTLERKGMHAHGHTKCAYQGKPPFTVGFPMNHRHAKEHRAVT